LKYIKQFIIIKLQIKFQLILESSFDP